MVRHYEYSTINSHLIVIYVHAEWRNESPVSVKQLICVQTIEQNVS